MVPTQDEQDPADDGWGRCRSEEMALCQLIIPAEAAHQSISLVGEVGLFQFKDLNKDKSAFQRTYANQVKRCDEMLRKLRFFSDQMLKADIMVSPKGGIPKVRVWLSGAGRRAEG